MKKNSFLIVCFLISFQCFSQRKILIDEGWRFHRGDIANAEQANFKDNSWRDIDLPHDWSIEDLSGTNSPFNPDAINGVSVGFTTGGIRWYRKTFTLPVNQPAYRTGRQNKRISILFDGVYMNSDVWINGVHLGNHPYGYTSFYYDITDKIKKGEKNIIAVQVKNEGANSRWYAGSGINRHVWLIETNPINVVQWRTYITTPDVTVSSAKVNIQTKVQNETSVPATITLINKIINTKGVEVARTSSKQTIPDYVRSVDNTRPVTAAANSVSDQKDAFFSALDVCGYNYAKNKYVSDHERKPNRIMVATESYALEQFDYWMDVLDHPWVIGDFVWTGFDYIGESSIGWLGYPQDKNHFYPWNLAYCGDMDICGWKRPQSFYRDALWKKDQLAIFVKPRHPSFPVNPKKSEWSKWNWDDVVSNWTWEGDKDSIFEVNIYSSCDEVELFLNNKSLGKKPTNRSTKFMAVYNVPYTAGALKAVGYDNGKKVNTAILKTADEPTQIKLSADRKTIKADNEDLSYITVDLVDKNGTRNPNAENLVHFEIEGPGTIAGVGNADPVSVESCQLPQRKAWQGRCLVIIKSKKSAGNIILKASYPGLHSSEVVIKSN
ncbi:MAG: DUF4982 domain-containing protein [Ginsengibacter sp.]